LVGTAADLVRNGVPSGSGQRIGFVTVRPLRAAQEANLDVIQIEQARMTTVIA
jgi:hypothetical protein